MSVNQHTGFPRRFVLVDFSTMAFMPNSKDRDTTVEVGPSFGDDTGRVRKPKSLTA